MVCFKHFNVFVIFLLSIAYTQGQTVACTLDIGGEASFLVCEIFQLNEFQKQKMDDLQLQYATTFKSIDEEITKLFENHPQSTPEELATLAEKYKVLQAKLINASKSVDEALIATFNQKQYNLYLSLCHEAFRKPIEVTPVVYDAVVQDEE